MQAGAPSWAVYPLLMWQGQTEGHRAACWAGAQLLGSEMRWNGLHPPATALCAAAPRQPPELVGSVLSRFAAHMEVVGQIRAQSQAPAGSTGAAS